VVDGSGQRSDESAGAAGDPGASAAGGAEASWGDEIDTCVVSDALDALGLPPDELSLSPLWTGARVIGPVVTVRLDAGPTPASAPKLHLGASAIARSRPGDVIVMANEGRTGMGCWGGMLTRAAMSRGVAGVILDGCCRDVDEARQLQFPVFGRGGSPRTARGRIHESACGEPVQVGPTLVRTGDWVIADGSGVVFIPAERVPQVRERARELAREEASMIGRLNTSGGLASVFGADYEGMLTDGRAASAGQES
jgi:4-hydroxy-4-methyl-2-oxoglutarate aldolase